MGERNLQPANNRTGYCCAINTLPCQHSTLLFSNTYHGLEEEMYKRRVNGTASALAAEATSNTHVILVE